MRFRHISDNKETWWVPVSIPARELRELLDARFTARYLTFEIELCVTVAHTEEGVSFDYTGDWAFPPAGNYPERVINAISEYLRGIRVEERFSSAIRASVQNNQINQQ